MRTYKLGNGKTAEVTRLSEDQAPSQWECTYIYGPFYRVDIEGQTVGYIHSHDGPGVKDGNVRWFDWLELETGEVRNWTRTLGEAIWENCR